METAEKTWNYMLQVTVKVKVKCIGIVEKTASFNARVTMKG